MDIKSELYKILSFFVWLMSIIGVMVVNVYFSIIGNLVFVILFVWRNVVILYINILIVIR